MIGARRFHQNQLRLKRLKSLNEIIDAIVVIAECHLFIRRTNGNFQLVFGNIDTNEAGRIRHVAFPSLLNAGLVSQMTVRVDTTMDRRNDLGSFSVFTTSGETAYSAGIRLMQNPDVSNGFQDTRGACELQRAGGVVEINAA